MTRKDVLATVLTALAVLAFLLLDGSPRWAAGVITLLGVLTCGLGSPGKDRATKALALLGVAAGAFAVWALATGSSTALSFLIADVVVLWLGSLTRHARLGRATSR